MKVNSGGDTDDVEERWRRCGEKEECGVEIGVEIERQRLCADICVIECNVIEVEMEE